MGGRRDQGHRQTVDDSHRQALSYLKVTELPLALLINFNVPLLKDGVWRVVPPLI